jgi:hypothetical protein
MGSRTTVATPAPGEPISADYLTYDGLCTIVFPHKEFDA